MPYQIQESVRILHCCVGVLCDLHHRCARYAFINGTSEPSSDWLGNCAPFGGIETPGFIDIDHVGPPQKYHFGFNKTSVSANIETPCFT